MADDELKYETTIWLPEELEALGFLYCFAPVRKDVALRYPVMFNLLKDGKAIETMHFILPAPKYKKYAEELAMRYAPEWNDFINSHPDVR